MVTIGALWLPILLAAILVWIASAIAWTASPHHKSDFRVIPEEDDFLDKVRTRNLEAGQYGFPYSLDPKEMRSPEMVAKMTKGPVGILTVRAPCKPNMAKPMMMSFVFNVVVSVVAAYLAGRTLAAGEEYLTVFRVTGTFAFAAYAGAVIPDAIWFGTPWSRTWKTVGDGLVYALLTAGVFGAMWP